MKNIIYSFLLIILISSCANEDKKDSTAQETKETTADSVLHHPEWSKNATIYEANIRQMTPEGTFNALEGKLESIKDLGIKIVWLMPIQPIGKVNRKGGLGSYYSITDYKAVNPEFGTMDDLKSLVNKAHELDMKVLLDWVANHTAWDHVWAQENPEWFTLDSNGNFMSPNPDWSDVMDLNYDNPEMRAEMINDLIYWVKEADVDGYRCDVAYMVPTDFWEDARKQLDAVKPVFMLAEADMDEHHLNAFDMSYGWELMHIMNHIASGDSSLSSIDSYMSREQKRFSPNDYRMYFLTNHDENSWNGTIEKRFGPSEKAFAVLAYTINGMPLIYSGQEYGNNKALEFFEKDTPNYVEPEIYDFYQTLIQLNVSNQALWNGNYGGDYARLTTTDDENIFALKREKGDNMVIAISNFSDQQIIFNIQTEEDYFLTDVFTNDEIEVNNELEFVLEPYGYKVMQK